MLELLGDNLTQPENHEHLTPTTMIVLMPDSDHDSLFELGHRLSDTDPVLFLGVVPIPFDENISAGAAAARNLREMIQSNIDRVKLRAKARIRVTYTPWEDVRLTLVDEPDIQLLVLSYPDQLEALHLTAAELLSHPPCDIALLRGPFPKSLTSILVSNLGDPHAQRALRLSLALARSGGVQITSVRLRHSEVGEEEDVIFTGMRRVLAAMPDIKQRLVETKDRAQTILKQAEEFDLIIMGTIADPTEVTSSFGTITDTILKQSSAAVIAVKTKQVMSKDHLGLSGAGAISILVDRWFAENTFHAEEFANLEKLLALTEERGVAISLD